MRVDGTLGWTFSRAIPLLDGDGEIVEWFGAASDVTARKQAEKSVREREGRFRTLFESMDEVFCVIEMIFDADARPADYRFLEIKPAFEQHTGIREQPWGKGIVMVAQTGWGQEDDKRKSQDAGFDCHMVKPVDPAALEKLLATCRADTG